MLSLEAYVHKLEKTHEALLNTLAASQHFWIKKVYKNASAWYETLKKEKP
jgi:hypothetical protein